MTPYTDTTSTFSYESFDRQLYNFYMMSHVLIKGWEDYSSQEMTFDINSLCIKASRLCYMADQDLAIQHTDISHQRKQENETHLAHISLIVVTELSNFLKTVIQDIRNGKKVEGHKSPMFPSELSSILPKLSDLLISDGMTSAGLTAFNIDISQMEKDFMKKVKFTKFPSVRYEERLWNLIRFYMMACYLLLHFRRVCQVSNQGMSQEEAARLMEMGVQKYMNEGEGKRQLELYFSNLVYDNNGKPLNEQQLLDARKELKKLVPQNLKLAFLNYADDVRQLGAALVHLNFTADEYYTLQDATAKYQLIQQKIYELHYPEEAVQTLHNEVFYTVVNGRAVNMQELKKSIAKMVALVSKKNQWFCVWSVLKHHNLLRDDITFSAFANQMMSKDWFGDIEPRRRFSADNLSDYSHYFAEYDYTRWNKEMFLEKKELFGMKKWSNSLFDTFFTLCQDMEKAIWGFRFFRKEEDF